jgi:hypothetical protein
VFPTCPRYCNACAFRATELPIDVTIEVSGKGGGGVEASRIIQNGDGFSGAHNDIALPEVAHAMWQAARSRPDP